MRIKVDISKLPTAPYPKTQPPKTKKPDIPFEYSVVQEVEAIQKKKKKKKRNWSLVRRGVNHGKVGAPVFWTPERNAIIAKLRSEGKTFAEIGDEFGKSRDAVRRQWYNIRDGRAQIGGIEENESEN